MQKKLYMAPNKARLIGDYLIDDMTKDGQKKFIGKLILFGSKKYPDWQTVLNELL